MQKNKWSRKNGWIKSGTTEPYFYYQDVNSELYDENKYIAVGDIYFRLNKYLTGVTFTYINNLRNIYKKDILTGDGYSIFNMYNEYDIIDYAMKNLVSVDVAADTNIDIDKQWFKINDIKLKPGHLILLKNQDNTTENDIYIVNDEYFLDNANFLSSKEKSEKFSCFVKLGKNADKQYFLQNVGNSFPLYYEPKNFIEGDSFILKHLIKYNLYNTDTSSGKTSKIIFTDYDVARKQLSENYELYYNTSITGITYLSNPSNFVTINYHHDFYPSGYTIRYDDNCIDSGITSDIININNLTYIPIQNINFIVNDNIDLKIYSGSTSDYNSGSTVYLNLNTYVKNLSGSNYIILEESIPDYILKDLKNCYYVINDINIAASWNDAIYKLTNCTPYSIYYSVSTIKYTISSVEYIDIILEPKEYEYNKYFDYNGLYFNFDDNQYFRYFNTLNQYINYNLYDRLNQINSTVFTSGFTFFNEDIISGDTLTSYKYIDSKKIKIKTSLSGLTSVFKPYTYVYLSSGSEITQKTLVYSVDEYELIIEKPKNWTTYSSEVNLPQIISIQNIDGLKNISDILYEVYINQEYVDGWYIEKSDNERKHITKSYADLLASNSFFISNVTGILYENDNNEFILKLYDIENDVNLYYDVIELVKIGSDRESRLPLPLKRLRDSKLSVESEVIIVVDFNVLNGNEGVDFMSGEVYDSGLNNVIPGVNIPELTYNIVINGFDSV